MGELGAGGGLADAVDADDEEDERLAIEAGEQRRGIGGQALGDVAAGGFDDIIGGDLAAEPAEFRDDLHREFRPEVGGDEVGFELVPVDLRLVCELVVERFEEAGHEVRGF